MRQVVRAAALFVFLAASANPQPVAAQAVGVTTVQGLSFGSLMPGMISRVTVGDAGRAEVVVSARGRITVVVQLPPSLQSNGGATVPVTFGATDGQYQLGTGQPRTFDPRSPLTVTVPQSAGTLRILLGGSVAAAADQSSGAYGATMTVQVIAG